jgi:FkbM family methyltransferase
MLIRILGKILPQDLRRFLIFLLHGIKVKPVRRGVCFAEGFGIGVFLPWGEWPWGEWRAITEISKNQVYEQVFKVGEGDVVIDVGAHVGVFTVKAAKAVGEDGLVIAIEPHPRNMNLLCENVKKMSPNTNVVLIKKAVGDRKGMAKLYLSPFGSGGHSLKPIVGRGSKYLEVAVDTLDNIVSKLKLKKVDFIKIDAEGAELEILKGAEEILKLNCVKLAIAAYHQSTSGESEFPEIQSFLKSRGARVWVKNNSYIYAKTGKPHS